MHVRSAMRLLMARRGRFFVRLLAVHLVLAAILVPTGLLVDPRARPWTAYALFGLVWWSFAWIATGRLAYLVTLRFAPATRVGMLLVGGCGLLAGAFITLAETAIVSGYPPVVLTFTPLVIVLFVGGGMIYGGIGGAVIGWLARRLARYAAAS